MPEKTNFSKILSELKAWGINDYELERQTGIKRSNFTKLRTGKAVQPKYDDGVAIMKIYEREKKKHS